MFAHTPVRFIFIPAKNVSLKDAIVYMQESQIKHQRIYNAVIPFSSDSSQLETVSAVLAACMADKIAGIPKVEEYITSFVDSLKYQSRIKDFSSPSICFFRQVIGEETNKEAKHSAERTAAFYKIIIHELALTDDTKSSNTWLSLLLDTISNNLVTV